MWHRLQPVICLFAITDSSLCPKASTFIIPNLIAMSSQPSLFRTSLVCVHSLILLVRTETEGLRRRLWGRSAPLLFHVAQTSACDLSVCDHRLKSVPQSIDLYYSEFDRNVLATLTLPNEFSMRSFIDSPCEN